MDDFSVCPRRYLHAKISPYSLANFSEISVIHCKLLPVLEVSSQNFYRQIALSSTELRRILFLNGITSFPVSLSLLDIIAQKLKTARQEDGKAWKHSS